MTDDYTKQIEDENEKLRLRLSKCEEELEHWKPMWTQVTAEFGVSTASNNYVTVYGSNLGCITEVHNRDGSFSFDGYILNDNKNKTIICKGTVEECKKKIELYWNNPKEYENNSIEELRRLSVIHEVHDAARNKDVHDKRARDKLADWLKKLSKGYNS